MLTFCCWTEGSCCFSCAAQKNEQASQKNEEAAHSGSSCSFDAAQKKDLADFPLLLRN